ncbi:histidinol-phosphatase [Spirochaeta cellobiosiphila]|uniref:histidinol-phosphatase n=1 Tax=Spirochaeta cellobiosiphila TaxID=504483 RepID=UPI0004135762|nr:histidinol-phosphatase [Spirochaeta cellobiosiphila]
MLKANYHSHSHYCDGQGELEDYIESAIQRDFDAIGFTSHGPVPFHTDWTMPEDKLGSYLKEIEELQVKYKGQIELYKGLEIDYIPGITGPALSKFQELNLDVIVGSVHYLPADSHHLLTIDGPQEEVDFLYTQIFKKDSKAFVQSYYQNIVQMVKEGGFSIIGHFDLIKKRNKKGHYFDETQDWYEQIVADTLVQIGQYRESHVAMEVNTGGISRGAVDTVYPDPKWLPEMRKAGIPVLVNSDAHHPDHLDFYFTEGLDFIRKGGYSSVRLYYNNKWQDMDLG